MLTKKSESKGKDSKGKKGKGKSKGKTDKDVCLKIGQRGLWAKNGPNPAKAIHGLAGNVWWQWDGDGHEWAAQAEQSPAESQRGAPSQPVSEPDGCGGKRAEA